MQWHVCAIKDKVSDTFLQPFCVRHQGEARRHFRHSVNGADSVIGKSPDDFELFVVGLYDDSTGHLIPASISSLGVGTEYLNK